MSKQEQGLRQLAHKLRPPSYQNQSSKSVKKSKKQPTSSIQAVQDEAAVEMQQLEIEATEKLKELTNAVHDLHNKKRLTVEEEKLLLYFRAMGATPEGLPKPTYFNAEYEKWLKHDPYGLGESNLYMMLSNISDNKHYWLSRSRKENKTKKSGQGMDAFAHLSDAEFNKMAHTLADSVIKSVNNVRFNNELWSTPGERKRRDDKREELKRLVFANPVLQMDNDLVKKLYLVDPNYLEDEIKKSREKRPKT
jgi:hypothetical protein